MVWVEARAFGIPLAAMTATVAFFFVAHRLHMEAGGAIFFAMVIIATVWVGGTIWSNDLDRGRKARIAPIVFRTIGIGGGALGAIFQLWNAAAQQHSHQDAISLIVGAALALLIIAMLLRNLFARRAGRATR
jgi:lipopolysaccharide export LptBFGC system permease protein LptF